MTRFLSRPILHDRAVEQALEAMRTGSDMRDHVLYSFLSVRERLLEPYEIAGQAALQVAVFDLLSSVIVDRFSRIRAAVNLPPPDPAGANFQIATDFSCSNAELEAWALLYLRYVCIDQALSMTGIASLTGVPERTLRRRLERGIRRLTLQLVRIEREARRQNRLLRLRLALPQSQPPILVGVETLLPTLVHLLTETDPPRHVLLHGPVGIGKSAIALAAAHRLADLSILDDVVWLALGGEVLSIDTLVNENLERLGLRSDEHVQPVQALRAYLFTHTVLIVLDSTEGIAAQSEALLGVLDMALVILTSRIELPPEVWCSQITIPELSCAHALALLDPGDLMTPRQRARWDAAWSSAGGNPLALKLVWAALRHLPDSALESARPLASLLDSIWNGLPLTERQLCLAAGLFHPLALPYSWCESLLDIPPVALASALATLCRMSLFEARSNDQSMAYTVPSMVASFVLERVRTAPASDDDGSLLQFVRALLTKAAQWLLSHPDPFYALQIVQVARRISLSNRDRWTLLVDLASQIMSGRLWHPWLDELRACNTDALTGEQLIWRDLQVGVALRWLGDFTQARTVFESLCVRANANPPDHASALVELSVVRRYQGEWGDSLAFAQSALEIELREEDESGVERCIHELAQIAVDSQDASRALAWLSRLSRWDARAWGTASRAYELLGHFSDAIMAAHRSLDLLPQAHPDRGRAMAIVANAYTANGQYLEAVDYLTAALDLLDHAGDVIGYARCANNLAAVSLHLSGDGPLSDERLRQMLTQALEVQRRCGDALGEAVTHDNLARLLANNN